MKPIPVLLTFSVLALAVGPLTSLGADADATNRRDYSSSTGGVILIGGPADNASPAPAGSAAAPAVGSPAANAAGTSTAGSVGSASAGVASTSPVPAVPSTPPPPPPQRVADRRAFNDPNGGVSIWLPNLLNGLSAPAAPSQPGNRRDFP